MNKEINIINVPFALGSHRRGCDLAPKAIKHAGLNERLKNTGVDINKIINSEVFEKEYIQDKTLLNLESILKTSENLATYIDTTVQENKFPLIVGGDHSIAHGTIAGL